MYLELGTDFKPLEDFDNETLYLEDVTLFYSEEKCIKSFYCSGVKIVSNDYFYNNVSKNFITIQNDEGPLLKYTI